MALRGVWQLQKLVVNHCDWGGSSRGIRYFGSSTVVLVCSDARVVLDPKAGAGARRLVWLVYTSPASRIARRNEGSVFRRTGVACNVIVPCATVIRCLDGISLSRSSCSKFSFRKGDEQE
jgi:hypothetical protein